MRSREGTTRLVVREIVAETPSIVSLRLEDPGGGELAPWEAGSHIDVQLITRHERQYSLCGDPADRFSYRIAVLREELSRGASDYIHTYLKVGGHVFVGAPRNHFPIEDASAYLLIAAGIGITPILAIARDLQARGADWRMLYLVRDRSDVALADEIAALGSRVQVHVSAEEGRIDVQRLFADVEAGTDVYSCGPGPFIDALTEHAGHLPPGSRIHTERFKPARREWGPDEPFTAVCAVSEQTVDVPAESSLLVTLAKAGIEVSSSCMSGVCGSCVIPLIAGSAQHRDSLGTDDSSGIIYPCVSRAAAGTTLTLGV